MQINHEMLVLCVIVCVVYCPVTSDVASSISELRKLKRLEVAAKFFLEDIIIGEKLLPSLIGKKHPINYDQFCIHVKQCMHVGYHFYQYVILSKILIISNLPLTNTV